MNVIDDVLTIKKRKNFILGLFVSISKKRIMFHSCKHLDRKNGYKGYKNLIVEYFMTSICYLRDTDVSEICQPTSYIIDSTKRN